MQDTLQRYLDDNKMHSFEGSSGVTKMEKVMSDVCGYTHSWGGIMQNFFADNPGACQAVVEWIGTQCERGGDWKDNLESLVGPEEDDEVGDLVPPEALSNSWALSELDKSSHEGWDD
jgi:hypothetical protein